ncbi:MAG: EamA family transporter [Flavobacteriaceae bacterium]|nr:EamA family transporter [Flavobacteriaceae bacterium]|tara:strand:- start:30164 stop:31060 length:897 start_codon:yes stop_codon:yes gene_type:complete
MDKKKLIALIAAFTATTIYGLNHTIAKEVMPHYIGGFGFIQLRVMGAGFLFFICGFFVPRQKIDTSDYLRLFFAALLGMCINMLMFFKGLELSTPINSSVIITLTPVIVLVLSYIFLGEQISLKKLLGIAIGFTGAIVLIVYGKKVSLNAPNATLGNIMFLINASAFAGYLVLSKPLTQKYHTIVLMKWMFLIGIIFTFPVTFTEFQKVEWTTLPFDAIWRMCFVVIGTTFLTYMLNIFALKTLPASTIGAIIYLQPLIAILYAIISGNDSLDFVKCFAMLLVFCGVSLAASKNKDQK